MSILQSILALNGLSKSIALVQKLQNAVFWKFLVISKWRRQKREYSNLQLAHHLFFETGEPLAAAPVVVRDGAYCLAATWVHKTTLFWRKLNEISENVSFDSEFTLGFQIQSSKVAFFGFFLNANFSKYSRADWVK